MAVLGELGKVLLAFLPRFYTPPGERERQLHETAMGEAIPMLEETFGVGLGGLSEESSVHEVASRVVAAAASHRAGVSLRRRAASLLAEELGDGLPPARLLVDVVAAERWEDVTGRLRERLRLDLPYRVRLPGSDLLYVLLPLAGMLALLLAIGWPNRVSWFAFAAGLVLGAVVALVIDRWVLPRLRNGRLTVGDLADALVGHEPAFLKGPQPGWTPEQVAEVVEALYAWRRRVVGDFTPSSPLSAAPRP